MNKTPAEIEAMPVGDFDDLWALMAVIEPEDQKQAQKRAQREHGKGRTRTRRRR